MLNAADQQEDSASGFAESGPGAKLKNLAAEGVPRSSIVSATQLLPWRAANLPSRPEQLEVTRSYDYYRRTGASPSLFQASHRRT